MHEREVLQYTLHWLRRIDQLCPDAASSSSEASLTREALSALLSGSQQGLVFVGRFLADARDDGDVRTQAANISDFWQSGMWHR